MTNGAAIGYALIAARWIGLDEETRRKLERAMYKAMNEATEKFAEMEYQNS